MAILLLCLYLRGFSLEQKPTLNDSLFTTPFRAPAVPNKSGFSICILQSSRYMLDCHEPPQPPSNQGRKFQWPHSHQAEAINTLRLSHPFRNVTPNPIVINGIIFFHYSQSNSLCLAPVYKKIDENKKFYLL